MMTHIVPHVYIGTNIITKILLQVHDKNNKIKYNLCEIKGEGARLTNYHELFLYIWISPSPFRPFP